MTGNLHDPILIGLGEILWDMLPSGKQLGGAPANFAYHAQALGSRGVVVSCIGEDNLGREILARLDTLNLDSNYIATDPMHPTGTVSVGLISMTKVRPPTRFMKAWHGILFSPTTK
jgi:fructokinase